MKYPKKLKIGEKLAAYSDAEIICPNVYNCLNCIENLSSLSIKRQQAYKSVMNPGGWVLTDSVNVSYDTLAKVYGFLVSFVNLCSVVRNNVTPAIGFTFRS